MGQYPPNWGGRFLVQPPTSSRGEARDFRQELGELILCPIPLLPEAVMTPPMWAATSPRRNQIVANPQLSWWEEEVDQADGREGDPMGMSIECPT